jgi:hypothetical protein
MHAKTKRLKVKAKRPKPHKRPKHVPPRPDTPKIPRPRPKPLKPFRPKRRRPKVDELRKYLAQNPAVANAIKWSSQAEPAWQPYPMWSSAQKAQLAAVYWQIRKNQFAGLSATPNTTYSSTGTWEGVTAGVGLGVDDATAWKYFLAYVAQSLVVEIAGLVPWSLRNYSSGQLNYLLTALGLYAYSSNANTYLLSGAATPGDPTRIYQFLAGNSFIMTSRRSTIGRLVDWCRTNMRHSSGSINPAAAQAYWQYNGYPPVERVISGTTHSQAGFAHWTFGCSGTTAFLSSVLRTLNIPVADVPVGGHSAPYFMSENLYLSHGDDPYDGLLITTPPIPIDELFIDRVTYDSWFDSNLPAQVRQDNVGRRCSELAVQYLTDWIVKLRCRDLAQGVTNPANSSVYNDGGLRLNTFYTIAELQAANLWARIDAKIAAGGGCGSLFPSPIVAEIMAPMSGSTVSGPVAVMMAVSGQTTSPNTFRLELQGQTPPLSTRTVTGPTDFFLWNTTVLHNGVYTLALTVTDFVGNSATTIAVITVANMIVAAIATPTPGSTVSGTEVVIMTVSGNTVAWNSFKLTIDGNEVLNIPLIVSLSATYNWDTTTVANGQHTLTLTITDWVGKTATVSSLYNVAN